MIAGEPEPSMIFALVNNIDAFALASATDRVNRKTVTMSLFNDLNPESKQSARVRCDGSGVKYWNALH
jgi:hypothetical protein